MKDKIRGTIASYLPQLENMSDRIYDFAEVSAKEFQSSQLLVDYLRQQGFAVEQGIADMPTAFRAVYEQGEGGPSLGLLVEYDALEGIGHACGHHMQGPSIIGAALAVKELCQDKAYRLVIYGTPAEETLGGKIMMQDKGYFKDIDIALMMHGAPNTCVDVKCMALESFVVTFRGVKAHAAMSPHMGKSALDAVLLSFQGIEFMREHVLEDTRMHYTILEAGGPSNVVPGIASAEYTLRSYDTDYLQSIVERFYDVIKGASLMTGTTYEMERSLPFKGKIPCYSLNDLIMENAKYFEAPCLRPPREKTGSTDFGNVMYEVPGSCIRVAFVAEGSSAHSKEYLEAGKSADAHDAIRYGAEILAGTCMDILGNPDYLIQIKEEFRQRKCSRH